MPAAAAAHPGPAAPAAPSPAAPEIETETEIEIETALVGRIRAVMEDHWRPARGSTCPHPSVYRWDWLWDSCFHALIWDALDDPRCTVELASVFEAQTAAGFVAHMRYTEDPAASVELWGRRGASTITQPPMYGHAVAVAHRHGRDVSAVLAPATRALHRLLDRRRAPCGLLRIFHPWESGIDDHPRWAAWQPDPWDRRAWAATKIRLVRDLVVIDGEAVASPSFDVCPAGFNALVAWNALELASVTGDARLATSAGEVAAALDQAWDAGRGTWLDVAPSGQPAAAVRTLDALLPALVTHHPERARAALDAAIDPAQYGLPFGPAGVHPAEPHFAPDGYGRGSAWPHLTYLLWAAARSAGRPAHARTFARHLVAGAARSGLAEHWDPRTGAPLGARPQSWTGLAAAVIGAGPATGRDPAHSPRPELHLEVRPEIQPSPGAAR